MINILKKIVQDYNLDLAKRILKHSTYQPYLNYCEDIQVRTICKDCKCKQDAINKAIEVCGKPNTKEKIKLYAIAYANSTKEYRDKAIYYLQLFLRDTICNEETKNLYENLADIYVKNYDFEKALPIYNNLIAYESEMPMFYSKKTELLIKMNKIDEAILFLLETKKGPYYKKYTKYVPDTWFIDIIDNSLNRCIYLKQKGYKYKPRKNNQ